MKTDLIVIGFIFHFVGDYLLQNDWMAQNKQKYIMVAAIHAVTYSLPFLFISSGIGWSVILISHLLIDRFGLAKYWIMLVNWNWQSKNFGFDNDKPQFLSIWLLIVIDNTFHIIINSLSIQYL